MLDFLFNRGHNPKDFGIYYPEIKRIFIGKCGAKGKHRLELYSDTFAHAHVCDCQKDRGYVCFSKKEFVFDDRIVRHEVAHLRVYKWTCGLIRIAAMIASNEIEAAYIGHDEDWKNEMRKLGFKDPISPFRNFL